MLLVLSVDALSPPLSGIGRYTWELASRLSLCAGVKDVRYFCQSRWIADPSVLLDLTSTLPRKTWLQRKEPEWLRAQRLELQCRGRIFHGPNYFLPACADIGIATIHDLSVFRFPETHPIERIEAFEKHFQATLQKASYLITDTEAIRAEIMNMFSWPAERIHAIPLGVTKLYRERLKSETVEVLTGYGLVHGEYSLSVTTIEPRKKIDTLLAAYRRLPREQRERYPLVLIGGSGWKSERLHQQIAQCCSEGWLKYCGFVPESDLPVLYAGARLFVYPSQYEGFGLPVLEAMASGVPVVTSTDAALSEVTAEVALAVESDDEDALQQAIVRGLDDEVWREMASVTGLARSSGFTWEKCIHETIGIYKKVQGEVYG